MFGYYISLYLFKLYIFITFLCLILSNTGTLWIDSFMERNNNQEVTANVLIFFIIFFNIKDSAHINYILLSWYINYWLQNFSTLYFLKFLFLILNNGESLWIYSFIERSNSQGFHSPEC